MLPPIEYTHGSCINIKVEFADGDDPIDITDMDVTIVGGYPKNIVDIATVTKEPPGTSGIVTISISAEDAKAFALDSSNWFRLALSIPGGCTLTTEKIWIRTI